MELQCDSKAAVRMLVNLSSTGNTLPTADPSPASPQKMKRPRAVKVEEPIACPVCQKLFARNWRLRSHIRTVHENYRPHRCHQCFMRFRSAYDLRRHSTIHTNERFACDMCDTSFASKQRLVAHLTVNTNCRLRVD